MRTAFALAAVAAALVTAAASAQTPYYRYTHPSGGAPGRGTLPGAGTGSQPGTGGAADAGSAGGSGGVATRPSTAALFAKPFAQTSTWNATIGPTARFEDVPNIGRVPVGLSTWLVPDMISVPVFQAKATDPTWKLVYGPQNWQHLYDGSWKGSGNSPEVEARIRATTTPIFPYDFHTYVSQSATGFALPTGTYKPIVKNKDGSVFTYKAPPGIHPNRNSDAWMPVFQPDGTVVETYATIVLSDGTVVAQSYQVTDAALAGDGWQNGVTASMIPVYAGLIRVSDLASGRIDHAIKLLAPASLLATAIAYPALSFDRGAITQDPPYSGTLPMGARISLPPGVDAASLGIKTPLGRMVADAASRHGMIVTDQGGGGITMVAEEGVSGEYGWNWDVQDDLSRIVAASKRVTLPDSAYVTSDASR